MRTPRLIIVLIGFLFAAAIVATPVYMRGEFLSAAATNSPPVATNDNYTRHGGGTIGPLLANDSDPEGDPMHVQIETFPTQGRLFGLDGNSFTYALNNQSFIGTDSFTYKACDNSNACSGAATVTINIVNEAPVAGGDFYTVHVGNIGPMMANDSDPDGDPISWNLVTAPSHGTLFGLPNPSPPDVKRFAPQYGYTGPDSFTYKVCDQFGLCSAPATVTLSIVNNPPVPGPDAYIVRGGTIIGPLFANDFDPEGDSFTGPFLTVAAAHGNVFGLPNPNPTDMKLYVPHAGYGGIDSWQYQITDFLGASGTTTVTLFVLESDDAENAGRTSCNASIGKPVNVTNGNMYLQQTDFNLPGVGPALNIDRTYNSKLQTTGLFGRGWSSDYDESIKVYDATFIRLNLPDGRAVYFTRPTGSGAFAPLEKDFHGQVAQNGDGSFTLSFEDGGIHQFNASGKLLSLADRYNNQTTLAYDAGGKLVSVSDPFARVLSFTTNTNGQALSISDTMGTIAAYTYGGGNQLLSVTYADNSAFQFSYDGSFRLTSVSDALGNVLESHTYDAQGRALTSEKQGGVERYTLNYVSDTQTDVTDALGHTTKFTIDKSKGRNVVTKVEGLCSCGGSQVQTWTYDNQLNVTAKTDALNHTSTFTYDASGNRLTETDSTGTVSFTYNQFGEVLTRTDQLNGVTTNTYDAQGNLLTTKDALNNTTTFTYDAHGQLLTVTDARGKVTTFTWDNNGRLTQRKDANNSATNFGYDARARVTSVTNALNQTTSYEYDPAGRVKKIIYPDTNFVLFTYDLAGRRTKIKDPRGNETTFAYDAAYRLTSQTDALTQATSFGYDLMSNLTAKTDSLSRITNYEFDDFNRLKKVIYPAATTGATRLQETVEYDAGGNVKKRTDTAGRETNYLYDAADRLTTITDPASEASNFEYNARSQNTAVVDALNQRYTFAYDPLGRVTQTTRAGLSMNYVYDAVGNRTQRTDYNNAATNYAYDNLNRLTTASYPDATTVTYGYDVLSRVISAANANGTVTFSYDNRSRIATTTDVFNQTVGYSYDANGNRTVMTLGGAANASYVYDPVNRLTQLNDSASLAVTYAYDVANKLTSRNLPNGVATTYEFDGLDRLTRLRDATAITTIADNQYNYNTANQITQIADLGGAHAYGYDSVDRLTSATYPSTTTESYSYDGVGNRTSSHLSASYGYQPFNRLTSTATVTYSYDNNGNLTSKTDGGGTTQYAWDFENRLKQVTLPNGNIVAYKYDALGRRIVRTATISFPLPVTTSTRFIYDGADVIRDTDANGITIADYLNGPGIDNKVRQTTTTGAALYFLQDQLGSTRALTDALGNVIEQQQYDSFGNGSGSAVTRYDYTGRERDLNTGLMFYRARWYDPQAGRFISEDPIGFGGRDVNFYAYVKNGPLLFRDPSGLWRCDPIVGAILGAGAGGVVGIIGGALIGPWVGGVLGAATLGTVGTVAVPGGGTIMGAAGGAGAGAAAGATAGPVIGGLIGAGIGGYIGYKYCSGDTTCDDKPDNVIPFPTPRPTPFVPPPPPPPKPPGPGDECYQQLKNCLRFAGTDPVRSAACQAQFVECMQKKGLPTLWP